MVTVDCTIEAEVAYPLDTFKVRTGLGNAALREARKQGLKVRRLGLRSYVLGRDFLEYLETHGKLVGG